MPINVSIVEDDDGVRELLCETIIGARGFNLVSNHKDGEEAVTQIPSTEADVVLVDINLPKISGIECVRQLKYRLPKLQFIMLTIYDDEDLLFESLAAGASGYLLKRASQPKLLNAIREVLHGGAPMSAQISRMVVEYFHSSQKSSHEALSLTKRELEVLDQLSKGYLYKEISGTLKISFDTVRSHIRNIYDKLHVNTRTEAVVKYLKHRGKG